jgi:hypothetical protein
LDGAGHRHPRHRIVQPQLHVVAPGDLLEEREVGAALAELGALLVVLDQRVLAVGGEAVGLEDRGRRRRGEAGVGRLHAHAVEFDQPALAVHLHPRAGTAGGRGVLDLGDRPPDEADEVVSLRHEQADLAVGRDLVRPLHPRLPLAQIVLEAQREAGGLGQLELDADLDQPAEDVVRHRCQIVARGDDHAEAHGSASSRDAHEGPFQRRLRGHAVIGKGHPPETRGIAQIVVGQVIEALPLPAAVEAQFRLDGGSAGVTQATSRPRRSTALVCLAWPT